MLKTRVPFLLWLLILTGLSVQAQPAQTSYQVVVAPDKLDWTYKTGENVKFTVQVLHLGNLVPHVEVMYEIGPEKMTPTIRETKKATEGKLTIDGGTLKTPGFLRCIATITIDGTRYRGLATAGFEPQKIEPTVSNPSDFDAFWDKAKNELAQIPIQPTMTLLPERCTETVNVYHVSLENAPKGSKIYGILCMPKKPGKYPALLRVPGAGVRGYYGDVGNAAKGMITLEIGIHGIPVTMEAGVYNDIRYGSLSGYPAYNLDSPDRFYYKRVYLGCLRANDFLTSLPEFDGTNLAVTGGSQGGALSIVTAGLDKRVKWLGAFYPALSDVTGYLHGRAGGWPHYFDKNNKEYNNYSQKLNTVGYYDVVNFARRITVPGHYMWGFNDETCPPTSMYAAYNVISAPKQLTLFQDTGHWTYPEERAQMGDWLLKRLKGE
ncbi:cephalosporin-C deacetylase-like acetyl esterase [Dyadobacter jejuensis]|uniref:Cephalosporin-C deacetylase-like acetyl esterase n=2 Tax=Dyadobacter jejuensis TaxID=1082580 RepID=A0A316AGJ2_9BACT|nr:cephalosporin-C deacetylase-like acetyl esterase [Dyadobacter jejuensis]